MRALTVDAVVNDPIVRSYALRLWEQSGERVLPFALTVRNWLKRHVGFVHEYPEQLHRPNHLLHRVAAGRRPYGDCDDFAMLAAALLLAVGLPVRFAAVKPAGEPEFMHVFAQLQDERGYWRIVDPTADQMPPGQWDALYLEVV